MHNFIGEALCRQYNDGHMAAARHATQLFASFLGQSIAMEGSYALLGALHEYKHEIGGREEERWWRLYGRRHAETRYFEENELAVEQR